MGLLRSVTASALEEASLEWENDVTGNREIASDIMERMPEGAPLYEIARRIEFVAAVREGLADIERGDIIPLEQVERELPEWVIE